MKQAAKVLGVLLALFMLVSCCFGQNGLFVGLQGGYSAQKISLPTFDFDTSTSFAYGVRAGVKFFVFSVEGMYIQSAHNLHLSEFPEIGWADRKVDFNYTGLNVKFYFPVPFLNPFFSFGFGTYSTRVEDVDSDTKRGYNIGGGIELTLSKKLSLVAEGKYNFVTFNVDDQDFKVGDFSLIGGINFYF